MMLVIGEEGVEGVSVGDGELDLPAGVPKPIRLPSESKTV